MFVGSSTSPTQPVIIDDQQVNSGRFSISLSDVAGKIKQLAIPVMGMYVLSNIPGASAGPLAYSACIVACTGTGPAAPFCWTCCLAALFVPGP